MSDIDRLIRALSRGPRMLFLGQSYLRIETGEDIFLKQLLSKYGNSSISEMDYTSIFSSSAGANPQEAYAWMMSRSMYIPPPESLTKIAEIGWNGVVTSAIDGVIRNAFTTDRREVQPVCDEKYIPSDLRSKQRLNIWHLYGSVEAAEDEGKPPLREEQLWSRENRASVMASRIPELVTPLGVLCLEGYDIQMDWFNENQFYAMVNSLDTGQAHLFRAQDGIQKNQRIARLVMDGKLELHDCGLDSVIEGAEDTGKTLVAVGPIEADLERQIRVGNEVKEIPASLFREISSVGTLLSEFHRLPPQNLSKDREYDEFRRFLFESAFSPQWEGLSRGFAFQRDFFSDLNKVVRHRISKAPLRRHVILVHGQTGTGKSVSLSNLSFRIFEEAIFPVLHIERSTRRVRREIVDRLCEWAETEGAAATLVVWDGMQNSIEYQELLRFLLSRGRNVLLIGSSYRISDTMSDDAVAIEAPSDLSADEVSRFADFMDEFDERLATSIRTQVRSIAGSFLVLLYRLLAPSRSAIRRGVEREVSFTEGQLTEQALHKKIEQQIDTALAEQLKAAGLVPDKPMLSAGSQEIGSELITELQMLIGLIMVPGQFNLQCPFELLVRSLGKGASPSFARILQSVDLFRWSEDRQGNLSIGPRSSLEAQLVVQQRIGGAKFEIDYVVKLVENLRPGMLFEKSEADFCVELLQHVGPNGRKPKYYEPYFYILADNLERLRIDLGLENARIMLQESMLRRESAKLVQEEVERDGLLDKAMQVSEKALNGLDYSPTTRPFRSYVLTEIASTLGLRSKRVDDLNKRFSLAQQCFQVCFSAHVENTQNIYPIITVLWTAYDILGEQNFELEQRRVVEEAAWHAMSLADSEGFEGDAQETLSAWKMKIFDRIGEVGLSEKEFEGLLQRRSPVGIYLRSVYRSAFLFTQDTWSEDQRNELEQLFSYMDSFSGKVDEDAKLLYLKFKVWWAWKVGSGFNAPERSLVPLSHDDWSSCRSLISSVLNTPEFESSLRLKYLEALSCFHLNDFAIGFQLFNELERESMSYARRVHKFHTWSTSSGKPRRFSGTVAYVGERGRGMMMIRDISQRIPFLSHDSNRTDIKKGDAFSNLKVSFSMRGPLVDFRD